MGSPFEDTAAEEELTEGAWTTAGMFILATVSRSEIKGSWGDKHADVAVVIGGTTAIACHCLRFATHQWLPTRNSCS